VASEAMVLGTSGAGIREATSSPIRPMFLLADSQLLFFRDEGGPFLDRVLAAVDAPEGEPVRAAYLGASNGDVPEFYDIFLAAMEGIGVRACRMIPASPSADDRAFLDAAHVILLAGGDAERGYRAFRESGLVDRIIARYAAGAVLIGISAGAMQLGQRAWTAQGKGFDTFRLAPMLVAVHDEPEWNALTEAVSSMEGVGRGIGIPLGGGVVIHADLAVEPVRKALVEITAEDGVVKRALLYPGEGGEKT
jgi:Peptidase family S51